MAISFAVVQRGIQAVSATETLTNANRAHANMAEPVSTLMAVIFVNAILGTSIKFKSSVSEYSLISPKIHVRRMALYIL